MEFKKKSDQQKSQMFEALINGLLISNTSVIQNNKGNLTRTSSDSSDSYEEDMKKRPEPIYKEHTICFLIDEFSIKPIDAKLNNFKNNILTKYLKNSDPNENVFSVTILFLIKLTIYINKLEEIDKDSNLLDFLIRVSEILCKDAKKLQQKYPTFNPLISRNTNYSDLYEDFLNFILKYYILNKTYNKEDLLLKVNKNNKLGQNFTCVEYNREGKARLFSIKSHLHLISPERKKSHFTSSSYIGDTGSFSGKGSEKEDCYSVH